MRSKDEIQKIYQCWLGNDSQNQAAQKLSIPRGTIKDYYKKFSLGVYPNWQQGEDSKSSDESPCGFESHRAYHYSYLLGLYLGDGCISKSKDLKNGDSVYKFRLFQDEKYPNLIEKHIKSIKELFPANKINKIKKTGCWEIYFYNKNLVEYFPQHGKGSKHKRDIKLKDWQKNIIQNNPAQFLSGLYESDGCWFEIIIKEKYKYSFIDFSNKSEDIHLLYQWSCSLLGVETRRHGKENKQQITKSRKDFETLSNFLKKKS